ncbi:putative G10 protein [Trypanosoma vivax]|nr:putative G10 protein [Trypanosoma vivax]
MPKIRPGMRRPPPGFELITEKLDEYDADMRLAMAEDPLLAKHTTGPQNNKKDACSTADNEKDNDCDACVSADNGEDMPRPEPPLWRVARINRERTRYVYDAYHREKKINKDVLDYCCEMNFVDAGLVRRWGLPGYERLCCTACCVPGGASATARMVSKYTNRDKKERRTQDGTGSEGTCVCRVPKEKRRAKNFSGCTACGCVGCSSGGKRMREEGE